MVSTFYTVIRIQLYKLPSNIYCCRPYEICFILEKCIRIIAIPCFQFPLQRVNFQMAIGNSYELAYNAENTVLQLKILSLLPLMLATPRNEA